MTDELGDEFDEFAALMEETPSSGNHGRKSTNRLPRSSNDRDGEHWPSAHRNLDSEGAANRQFAATGGATVVHRTELNWHGAKGYEHSWHVLFAEEWDNLDMTSLRAKLLELLGVTEAELAELDKSGRLGPERRAIQERLDERLLQLKEQGGRTNLLGRLLGWPITNDQGDCHRMRRALRRARNRRAAA